MKKIRILSLTEIGTLLISQSNQSVREVTFEGFVFNTDTKVRYLAEELLIGKQIEGTINKKAKTLRYQDFNTFTKLLKNGLLKISSEELNESQLYTAEQKQQLRNVKPLSQEQMEASCQYKIKDYTSNRQELLRDFRGIKKKTVDCSLECLGEEIVIKIMNGQEICYLPVVLKNIDHFFLSVPRVELGDFIEKHSKVTGVELTGAYYDLDKKQYRLKACFPREFEFDIMKRGLGTVSLFNNCSIPIIYLNQLRSLQHQARKNHIGIFKTVFELLSLIYTKNNLVGTVEDVIDGYIFEIRAHASPTAGKQDKSLLKVELTNIYCPVGDQSGAFESRQFARKNLIGKQVNVFLKKNEGLNMHGSLSRIADGKDVECLMLQNGWAFVKEQIRGSLMAAKFEILEKKAKQKSKGVHKKELGTVRFTDLTKPNTLKEDIYLDSRLSFLNNFGPAQQGVVEQIIDIMTYKVRFDAKKTIIRMKLEGIQGLSMSPLLPEYKELKAEAKQFLSRNFKKRSVQVSLNDYIKDSNCFVGTIRCGVEKLKKDFQEYLLEESFVYCQDSSSVNPKYQQIEEQKRREGKKIWCKKLIPFRPQRMLQNLPQQFRGKFSWVMDGETVFIQPQSHYEALDKIWNALNTGEKTKLKKQHIQVGVVCVAPYSGELYRVRILSFKGKNIKVQFIDWGNVQIVEAAQLFELPLELQYVESQCCEATMNLVKALKGNLDCLEKVREELLEGQFQIVRFIGDSVDVFKGNEHINMSFIEKGYVKADPYKIADGAILEHLRKVQEALRIERAGVWEFSEKQDSESENQEDFGFVNV